MSVTLLDTGLILVTVRYVKALKPGGPYSYYRRIPSELKRHYGGLTFIRKSLGTKDLTKALKLAATMAAADDALWASLRSPEGKAEGLTTAANREGARALLGVLNLAPGMLVPGRSSRLVWTPRRLWTIILRGGTGTIIFEPDMSLI